MWWWRRLLRLLLLLLLYVVRQRRHLEMRLGWTPRVRVLGIHEKCIHIGREIGRRLKSTANDEGFNTGIATALGFRNGDLFKEALQLAI